MRIALPLKGKASQIFAGPVFDAEKQSAIIPIRHMKFDFDAEKIDPKFSLYTTNFTEPLSYQDSAFLKLPKFP